MRRFNPHDLLAAMIGGMIFVSPGMAGALQATAPTAAATTTAPASTMTAGAVALVANVTSVKGNVQVRAREGAAWEPVTVGMRLDQGAEIRTGLRSAVQFVIGGDQTITLDRLGTISVLRAYQSRGKATTDLGLKYGRTRYDIKATDLEHESTIRSPGSTLAIRGTDVTYEDQAPWVPTAVSREGRAEFRNFRRQFVAFGGTKRAAVAADKTSPAQQALSTTKNDPRGVFAGRTQTEDELNLTLQTLGGADADVQRAVQDVLRGFTAGPDTTIGPVTINARGPLEFTLEWSSVAGTFGPTNLDFLVTDPRGEVASPANPIIGTGFEVGQHFGDDPGTSGIGGERVAWGEFFPLGTYTVQAVHQGGDDAQLTITSFQGDGDELITTVIGGGPQSPVVLSPGETFTGTLTPPATTSSQSGSRAAQRAARRAERQQQRQALTQQRSLTAAARTAKQQQR